MSKSRLSARIHSTPKVITHSVPVEHVPGFTPPEPQEPIADLATLLRMVAEQRERITTLENCLQQMTARLDGANTPTEAHPEHSRASSPSTTRSAPKSITGKAERSARRSLLRTAGAAAAALVATGLTVESAPTARAADGVSVILGQTNTMTNPTVINPVTGAGPLQLLKADNSLSANTNPAAAGVQGMGPNGSNGVVGIANGAVGAGLFGQSDIGYGVLGASGTGIDFYASGTGRLLQLLTTGTGPPTTGSHMAGEQIRDQNGNLYLCLSGGSPGAWAKVVAYPTTTWTWSSGLVSLLSSPIRLFDTRSGQPVAQPATKAQLAGGSTTNVQVTGTSVGGVSVPAGAQAVLGNVTVLNAASGGSLILYPAGTSTPNTSTINYSNGSPLANAATVRLSSGGALTILEQGAATDVIFDAIGFITPSV